ncbi:hypothetical protein FB451DRAFT_1193479 [Mycena latifolia]|nr:hypothetical protein FB451DRAFT_1193479 [Mycena latifolia]
MRSSRQAFVQYSAPVPGLNQCPLVLLESQVLAIRLYLYENKDFSQPKAGLSGLQQRRKIREKGKKRLTGARDGDSGCAGGGFAAWTPWSWWLRECAWTGAFVKTSTVGVGSRSRSRCDYVTYPAVTRKQARTSQKKRKSNYISRRGLDLRKLALCEAELLARAACRGHRREAEGGVPEGGGRRGTGGRWTAAARASPGADAVRRATTADRTERIHGQEP